MEKKYCFLEVVIEVIHLFTAVVQPRALVLTYTALSKRNSSQTTLRAVSRALAQTRHPRAPELSHQAG